MRGRRRPVRGARRGPTPTAALRSGRAAPQPRAKPREGVRAVRDLRGLLRRRPTDKPSTLRGRPNKGDDAHRASPALYAPDCVEGLFYEVRMAPVRYS